MIYTFIWLGLAVFWISCAAFDLFKSTTDVQYIWFCIIMSHACLAIMLLNTVLQELKEIKEALL